MTKEQAAAELREAQQAFKLADAALTFAGNEGQPSLEEAADNYIAARLQLQAKIATYERL